MSDHNALHSQMTRAVCNDDLEDACRKYKVIVTDAGTYIQRIIATAYKLKKAAKVEVTDDGYVVQTTSSSTGCNVTEDSLQCDCPIFNTTMLPCKHIFKQDSLTLFHEKLVQERWLRTETSPVSGFVSVTKE